MYIGPEDEYEDDEWAEDDDGFYGDDELRESNTDWNWIIDGDRD